MRALTAGLRAVGLCVSRRLPTRAPAVVQRPGVVALLRGSKTDPQRPLPHRPVNDR